MPVLTEIVKIGIYLVMAISVAAALGAVLFKNIFHASLALIVTLIGIAGIFISLHAEFLAGVQLLLYVGAVMTLVIFAIMMTERLGDKTIAQQNKLPLPALSGAIIFLMTLVGIIYATPWPVKSPPLARALFATVDIDEEIPVEHYQAVAEIIGYVMKLRRGLRAPGRT